MWKAIDSRLTYWKKNWTKFGDCLANDTMQVYLVDWLCDRKLSGFLTSRRCGRKRDQLNLRLVGSRYDTGTKHEVTLRMDMTIPAEWMDEGDRGSDDANDDESDDEEDVDLSDIELKNTWAYKKSRFDLFKNEARFEELENAVHNAASACYYRINVVVQGVAKRNPERAKALDMQVAIWTRKRHCACLSGPVELPSRVGLPRSQSVVQKRARRSSVGFADPLEAPNARGKRGPSYHVPGSRRA